MDKIYDVFTVGAGPAGLTAALYCRRAEKSVIIAEKEVAGDCRTKAVRQITTAVGDGAVAAVAACRYLTTL